MNDSFNYLTIKVLGIEATAVGWGGLAALLLLAVIFSLGTAMRWWRLK